MSATNCQCDWKSNYDTDTNCTPQKPAVNPCAAILCLNDIDMIDQNACDPNDPENSGIITNITKATGANAVNFNVKKDTVDINSSEVLNDNENLDVSETVQAIGTVGSSQLCWVRGYKGKEVVYIFEDNDKCLWAIGFEGGFSLRGHALSFGVDSGSVKGITMDFENLTGTPIKKIVPDPAIYADNNAFMDALFN